MSIKPDALNTILIASEKGKSPIASKKLIAKILAK